MGRSLRDRLRINLQSSFKLNIGEFLKDAVKAQQVRKGRATELWTRDGKRFYIEQSQSTLHSDDAIKSGAIAKSLLNMFVGSYCAFSFASLE